MKREDNQPTQSTQKHLYVCFPLFLSLQQQNEKDYVSNVARNWEKGDEREEWKWNQMVLSCCHDYRGKNYRAGGKRNGVKEGGKTITHPSLGWVLFSLSTSVCLVLHKENYYCIDMRCAWSCFGFHIIPLLSLSLSLFDVKRILLLLLDLQSLYFFSVSFVWFPFSSSVLSFPSGSNAFACHVMLCLLRLSFLLKCLSDAASGFRSNTRMSLCSTLFGSLGSTSYLFPLILTTHASPFNISVWSDAYQIPFLPSPQISRRVTSW